MSAACNSRVSAGCRSQHSQLEDAEACDLFQRFVENQARSGASRSTLLEL